MVISYIYIANLKCIFGILIIIHILSNDINFIFVTIKKTPNQIFIRIICLLIKLNNLLTITEFVFT